MILGEQTMVDSFSLVDTDTLLQLRTFQLPRSLQHRCINAWLHWGSVCTQLSCRTGRKGRSASGSAAGRSAGQSASGFAAGQDDLVGLRAARLQERAKLHWVSGRRCRSTGNPAAGQDEIHRLHGCQDEDVDQQLALLGVRDEDVGLHATCCRTGLKRRLSRKRIQFSSQQIRTSPGERR